MDRVKNLVQLVVLGGGLVALALVGARFFLGTPAEASLEACRDYVLDECGGSGIVGCVYEAGDVCQDPWGGTALVRDQSEDVIWLGTLGADGAEGGEGDDADTWAAFDLSSGSKAWVHGPTSTPDDARAIGPDGATRARRSLERGSSVSGQ